MLPVTTCILIRIRIALGVSLNPYNVVLTVIAFFRYRKPRNNLNLVLFCCSTRITNSFSPVHCSATRDPHSTRTTGHQIQESK